MHLYSDLLYTQSALDILWGGGVSPQPPSLCSIHLDDVTAATGQRRQCTHPTPATGVEERVIEPIKSGQWREFGQDTGVTPLLFTRSAMGFLMTTESQEFGLMSHPKDSAFWQYSVPITTLRH